VDEGRRIRIDQDSGRSRRAVSSVNFCSFWSILVLFSGQGQGVTVPSEGRRVCTSVLCRCSVSSMSSCESNVALGQSQVQTEAIVIAADSLAVVSASLAGLIDLLSVPLGQ
jgi:hypothetical protein